MSRDRIVAAVLGASGLALISLAWTIRLLGVICVVYLCVSYSTRVWPNWIGVVVGVACSPLIFEWLPVYALIKDGWGPAALTALACWFSWPISFAFALPGAVCFSRRRALMVAIAVEAKP